MNAAVWLLAPNAGNDELVKLLLGAVDVAGGKLLVAPPPKELLPPKPNVLAPLPLLLGAGAEAPNSKPLC